MRRASGQVNPKGKKKDRGDLCAPILGWLRPGLLGLDERRRLPGAFASRQDGRRRVLGPVEAHHQIDIAVRRRQPVGFLVLAGRVLLDVERERAIRSSSVSSFRIFILDGRISKSSFTGISNTHQRNFI